ncbi:MAG: sugar phosphate isomerase/epimerase [Bacteroidetes bacterium]|nr:sugar phosphate isomerase/epimerase [Bacteroidota bacterium]
MKNELGIFAKTFSGDLGEVFQKAVNHELFHFQFNMSVAGLGELPQEIPARILDDIMAFKKITGVELSAMSATYNMIDPDREKKNHGFNAFIEISKACRKLDIDLITVCTGSKNPVDKWKWHPDNDSKQAWKELLVSMEEAIVVAETSDIYLGVEPELGNVVSSPEKAIQLIKELDSDRVQIVFDPANLFDKADRQSIRDIMRRSWDQLAEYVGLVHAKDRTEDGHYVAVGKGAVDFGELLGLVGQSDYRGPIIMHGLSEVEVDGCLAVLKR